MSRVSVFKRKGLFALSLFLVMGSIALWPVGEGWHEVQAAQAKDEPKMTPGGFTGRRADLREKLLEANGGTKESEAAVALGLEWLALHQSKEGSWALENYHQHARDKLGAGAKPITCDCKGTGQKNDTAGTALGLLPFLAAGHTHKAPAKGAARDYSATVLNGLRFLMSKQGKDGNFGDGMYAHGLAAITVCEAYAMTADPALKRSAQLGLDYIIYAQHEQSGGWRYAPKQSGDTSVTGWQLMALKSGQLAGLNVPAATLKRVEKWLDSAMDKNTGGYGYTDTKPTPTTTAVGLLCREYMGWGPRKPELVKGVELLAKTPPGKMNNTYHYYYATQVMHHVGGELWKAWNEGTDQQPGMRDVLIGKQNKKDSGHKAGSWNPDGDAHSGPGGRVMVTSLSLLTLQVYYRHVPLYREAKKE